MKITRVGVVGLGTMGSGILEVVARSGYQVIGVDLGAKGVDYARNRINESMERGLSRGKLTQEDVDAITHRISLSQSINELSGCDLVIEAVTEELETKRSLLSQLDSLLADDSILASNTSALSVTDLSVSTSRPSRVIGMHFFNPATVQRFVEIVQTVTTDQLVIDESESFVRSLGKNPVVVSDRAGFIANALLFGYLNQAVTMFEQKYASREDIDTAMKLGCGYPMGPLALLDLIGLDTSLQILDTMYRESRDRLHAPAALLKHLVAAGRLGRKSGQGFYRYESPNSPVVVPDIDSGQSDSHETDSTISKVAVVGSGTMATGIASVFAAAGLDVVVVTRSAEKSQRVRGSLEKSWNRLAEKGKISGSEAASRVQRVSMVESVEDLAHDTAIGLVIEAIAEDLEAKKALFHQLDVALNPSIIFATTTSSLPVIDISMATSRPDKFLGIHFFNPAPLMGLVEIVSTVLTNESIVQECTALIRSVDKTPVTCSDRAGFIVNALLFPYLNDAIAMASSNYASLDDIDAAMKLGCAYPLGPFELLDVVGLDVSLAIINTLYREFREPGFAPAPQLEQLVKAGFVGRKVGRGFRKFEVQG